MEKTKDNGGDTHQGETIRERLVREEREAQEKRLAEMRAARKRAEKEAAEAEARRKEAEEKRRAAEEERRKEAEEKRKRQMEQAKRDRADARKKYTAKLERQYVLFERAKAALDELAAAEERGELTFHVPYKEAMEKASAQIALNMGDTRQKLLNIDEEFRRLRIDEPTPGGKPRTPSEAAAIRRAREAKEARLAKESANGNGEGVDD